jgi:hypothetical protein
MTRDEANRVIAEAMGYEDIYYAGGWKYHNKALDEERGGVWSSHIPDYFTPEGFFVAWNWAKEQDWWNRFLDTLSIVATWMSEGWDGFDEVHSKINFDFIDPAVFPMKLAEWLKVKVTE